MAWPWGGEMTHAELARKFGWLSVIISIILFPLTFLWARLLAFPIWLDWLGFESKPKYTVRNELYYHPLREANVEDDYKYDGNSDDLFKNKFYEVADRVADIPSGWNCHIDSKGKKFFESFWGLINCLDCKEMDDNGKCDGEDGYDPNDNGYLHITSNWSSWLRVSAVFVEFSLDAVDLETGKKGCFAHRVRFFFPLDGPNMYNPFTWGTISFTVVAMTWFSKCSFKRFKEVCNVETISDSVGLDRTKKCPSLKWPEEPNNMDEKRDDGSIPFKKKNLAELKLEYTQFAKYGQSELMRFFASVRSDSNTDRGSSSGSSRLSVSASVIDSYDDEGPNRTSSTSFSDDQEQNPLPLNENTPILQRTTTV